MVVGREISPDSPGEGTLDEQRAMPPGGREGHLLARVSRLSTPALIAVANRTLDEMGLRGIPLTLTKHTIDSVFRQVIGLTPEEVQEMARYCKRKHMDTAKGIRKTKVSGPPSLSQGMGLHDRPRN